MANEYKPYQELRPIKSNVITYKFDDVVDNTIPTVVCGTLNIKTGEVVLKNRGEEDESN